MAACIRLVCNHCSNAIEAWDDGNPYYFDAEGKKQYAWHPDPKRELCTGNESLRLCLECGEQTMIDAKVRGGRCGACRSKAVVHLFDLAGKRCPACKLGTFAVDPNFTCVS